jgi:hypothetical protein
MRIVQQHNQRIDAERLQWQAHRDNRHRQRMVTGNFNTITHVDDTITARTEVADQMRDAPAIQRGRLYATTQATEAANARQRQRTEMNTNNSPYRYEDYYDDSSDSDGDTQHSSNNQE